MPLVQDRRVGTEVGEQGDDVHVSTEGSFVRGGGAAAGVGVEPEIDQQPDGVGAVQLGGTSDEIRPVVERPLQERGILGHGFSGRSPVAGQAESDEPSEGSDFEEGGDFEVAVQDGALVGLPSLVSRVGSRFVGVNARARRSRVRLIRPASAAC